MSTDSTPAGFVHEQRAVRVVFRAGSCADLPREVERLGLDRVAVVAGRRYADRVAGMLGARAVVVVADPRMHVPVEQAEAVRARATEARVDGLVAVGGGSAVGLAKAVALTHRVPIVAVPTSFSGSEMTRVWGTTAGGVKRTGRDPVVAPRVVLYDPELLAGFPTPLAVPSAFNALAHAVEARYAPDRTPVTDLVAEAAIGTMLTALPALAEDDPAGRAGALRGAWMCGMSLDSTSMSLHHKLAHVIGGGFALPHAETHTVLLPHVLGYNAAAAPDAAAAVGAALPGGAEPPAAGRALQSFAAGLGAPTRLADLGMPRDALDRVVDTVLDAPYANPAPLDRAALRELVERAWSGAPVP
ncbi:maleylacetate reductase [Nocardia farcinica]|uniref:maleylacetate reductase n=1 Tax=Nocardia farcinica TaxID=37329 RepID=UPI003792EC25